MKSFKMFHSSISLQIEENIPFYIRQSTLAIAIQIDRHEIWANWATEWKEKKMRKWIRFATKVSLFIGNFTFEWLATACIRNLFEPMKKCQHLNNRITFELEDVSHLLFLTAMILKICYRKCNIMRLLCVSFSIVMILSLLWSRRHVASRDYFDE